MTKKERVDRLMEIIKQIQGLYPQLSQLMIDDMENPESIMIASEDTIKEFAEQSGMNFESYYEGDYPDDSLDEDDLQKLIGYDGEDSDNNGNGGLLQ